MKNITYSNHSEKPIYQQLYENISAQILRGDIAVDSALPSIRAMAKELRVSVITIKNTWEILERNGYIYTIAGKGSYVANISQKTLDEKKQSEIEHVLKQDVQFAKDLGVSEEELIELVKQLYNAK